jgi:hypothetical protein
MGMVPIPVISALTFTQSDEPVLEPTLPISRVQPESVDSGEQPEEGYSPSNEASQPEEKPRGAETQSCPARVDPTHAVNIFA